jgi:hypothetical protein
MFVKVEAMEILTFKKFGCGIYYKPQKKGGHQAILGCKAFSILLKHEVKL